MIYAALNLSSTVSTAVNISTLVITDFIPLLSIGNSIICLLSIFRVGA